MLWIFQKLKDSGFDTWVVGGAIRDAMLGEPVEDWDLATLARPQQICDIFPRTVPIGIEHGTVGVIASDGVLYEVTTFRKDIEHFGRRAVVAFAESIEEDLARRDFTLNALAWSPHTGRMLDLFDGRKHLEQRKLKTVGSAKERFAEDLLRVLRALRFAGQFDLEIERDTWDALLTTVPELHHLSSERIQEEMMKVLGKAKTPSVALNYYAISGVIAKLFPEFCSSAGKLDSETIGFSECARACDKVSPSRPLLRLALLFSAIGSGQDVKPEVVRSSVEDLMHRLRFSNSDTKATARLVWARLLETPTEDPKQCRIWLNQVGLAQFNDLCRMWIAETRVDRRPDPKNWRDVSSRIRFIRSILKEKPPLTLSDLAVNGTNLQEAGISPGRRLGRILMELLKKVLNDPGLNSYEILIDIAVELERSEGKNVAD